MWSKRLWRLKPPPPNQKRFRNLKHLLSQRPQQQLLKQNQSPQPQLQSR